MKKAMIIVALAPLFAACGNPDLETSDFHALRGGKADNAVDTSLSCQGLCGDLATSPTSYCGCDDACASYGDCCADKTAVCDGTTPNQQACQAIEQDYAAALAQAKGCGADADCDAFAGGSLSCGIPHQAYNKAHAALIKSFSTKWQNAQCHMIPWMCPMLAPLPPWFEVHGVCEQGSCAVKYVDTRAAKEGDACGDDIGVSCGDGLYCAFGLNWCGTPPVTGICRQMGDCGAPSDCLDQNNDWIHPACMGQATCDGGKCGWDCSAQPF